MECYSFRKYHSRISGDSQNLINIGNIARFSLAAIVGSPATQASPLGRWERRRSKIPFQDQRISVGFSGNGLRAFLGAPYPEVPGNFSTRGTIPITGRCLRLSPGLNPKPGKNGIIDRLSRAPVRIAFLSDSSTFPPIPRQTEELQTWSAFSGGRAAKSRKLRSVR